MTCGDGAGGHARRGQERATATPRRCRSADSHLTDREVEVLLLAAAGLRNAQIARSLGISVRTVDWHLMSMLRRIGAESRAGLISRCWAAGMFVPGAWPPTWSSKRCLSSG